MAVTPVSPTAGQLVDKTFWDAQIYQQFVDLYAGWTPFTPTWKATTTNPAIGNGAMAGAYKMIGKTVFLQITMVMGSTTTFGSGQWQFDLPSTPGTPVRKTTFAAFAIDSSAGLRWPGTCEVLANTNTGISRIVTGAGGTGTAITSAVPFTWTTSDELMISGTYEVS